MNLSAPVMADEELFAAKIYQRIVRTMVVLPFLATPVLWVRFDGAIALSFLAGCAIALVNFYWLKKTVAALVDEVAGTGERRSGSVIVGRFLLRYVLMAVGAYVIVRGSAHSAYGFFAGLLLPVPAILLEAVYGAYGALRRRF